MPAPDKPELPRAHAESTIAGMTDDMGKAPFFSGILDGFSVLKFFECNIMVYPLRFPFISFFFCKVLKEKSFSSIPPLSAGWFLCRNKLEQ